VPEDHLVWTIPGAVEELDLSGFYGGIALMVIVGRRMNRRTLVALLLYSYVKGIGLRTRPSARVERARTGKAFDDPSFPGVGVQVWSAGTGMTPRYERITADGEVLCVHFSGVAGDGYRSLKEG
jgi:hypothetical protein